MKEQGFTTHLVHHDYKQKLEFGAIHAPVHNSATYGYDDIQDLIDIFQGFKTGQAYARQATPTIDMLQNMICEMEQGKASLCYSSGMAAIVAVFLTLLKNGDHIVASRFLFGNTSSVFGTLSNFGIEVTLVDATDVANVAAACQPNTKIVFVETIANPATQVCDLVEIGDLCDAKGLLYVIDNTLTSAVLFQPKSVKCHLIVTSLSKHFGGHGNVIGGSVTDTGLFDWSQYPNIFEAYRKGDPAMWGYAQLKKKGLRDMGACLSSEAAAQLALGAETMALRVKQSSHSALTLAHFLQNHPKVAKVYYPGLESHPQYARSSELFKAYGSLVSLDLKDGLDCCQFINALQLVIGATHLGDNRSLVLPVAPTIYYEVGLAARQQAGISENMIRCSIGIEDTDDLIADFTQALACL
ncbi:MAG: O-acetylhomoserine (thiol)-lyase [Moritella sp.]|jgi:O-acetylhomoserine (thiol)-lyase